MDFNTFNKRVELTLRFNAKEVFTTADFERIERGISFGIREVTSALSIWWRRVGCRLNGFEQIHVNDGSGRKAYVYNGKKPLERIDLSASKMDDEAWDEFVSQWPCNN